MLTSIDGITASCPLRVELVEDAANELPHAVLRELLVMFDAAVPSGLDVQRTSSI